MSPRITPELDQFRSDFKPGFCAALSLELPADLETPVTAYLKLKAASDALGPSPSFLLESVERGESLGRFSFISTGIARRIEFNGAAVRLANGCLIDEQPIERSNPLSFVRRTLSPRRPVTDSAIPALLGGAVGYLGYDIVRHFERLPAAKPDTLGEADGLLLLPESLLVFDHALRIMRLVALVPEECQSADEAHALATAQIERMRHALALPLSLDSLQVPRGAAADPQPSISQLAFENAVERAKEYITAGDVFQVVLSQRLTGETSAHPFQVYRALRILNPSPYMFYLDFGELKLIGSSPEVLVKLVEGQALLNPIAGTRPRGATPEEDDLLQAELLASEKERAEHVMLVDLARNDLGRACATGSVTVTQFMKPERYSQVMHLVSHVSGHLNGAHDSFDLLQAAFPAGTVSGAPKVRAMEIIEELEPCRRGPYGGAVGYLGANGDMDMCITIRSIVMQGQRYHLQAGAGIVADSDPTAEYNETLHKMAALRDAIRLAEEGI
jgi:anthranilate synthase component 1